MAEIDHTEAMNMFTPSTKEESSVFNTQWVASRVTMDISPTILATSRKNTMTTRGDEVVKCVVAEVEVTNILAIINTLPSTNKIITITQYTSLETIIKIRKIVDINTTISNLHVEETLAPEECAPCPIINITQKCVSVGSTSVSKSVVSSILTMESQPLEKEKVTCE